jgi:hypothetical protein
MREIIIEGLDVEDFLCLQKIIEKFNISLNDDISFEEVSKLHNKIQQVISHISE